MGLLTFVDSRLAHIPSEQIISSKSASLTAIKLLYTSENCFLALVSKSKKIYHIAGNPKICLIKGNLRQLCVCGFHVQIWTYKSHILIWARPLPPPPPLQPETYCVFCYSSYTLHVLQNCRKITLNLAAANF